jgi:capsular polysaccharide biosynthesis protein
MALSWQNPLFRPRPVHIAALEGAWVVAEGLVVAADGEVILPTVQQHQLGEIDAALDAIRVGRANNAIPRLQGTILLCRKPGVRNYGHWLVEMLPRIWLAAQHAGEPFAILVQDVDEPLRTVMAQSLILLGVDGRRVITAGAGPVRADRLLIVDGMTSHGTYMSPWAATCLRAIAEAIPARGPDRLFIHRGSVASRRFVDEQRVLDRAAHAGFSILDPATLPLRTQIAAFKAARCIVGATGAAMTNLVFGEPGIRAFTLTPATMPDTFFWFLAGHGAIHLTDIRCQQDGPVRGPLAWDTDIALEAPDFAAICDLAAGPPAPPIRTAQQAYDRLLALFDPAYYRVRNPDVANAGLDPFEHFLAFGWREGRNPSPAFDIAAYKGAYPDVAASGYNPLLHYVLRGESEGRRRVEVAR